MMLESFTPKQKLEIFEMLEDMCLKATKTIYAGEPYYHSAPQAKRGTQETIIDPKEFSNQCRKGADEAREEIEVELMEEDDCEDDRSWDQY